MDTEYLLLLQNFRNAINDLLTPFMEWISHFAVNYLLGAAVLAYWCFSKRKGLYVLVSTYVSVCINAIIKLTVCAYRPWIRDSRIVPAGDAITESTGYSFPSGHTSTAVPIYGGLAHVFQKRWLSIICITLMIITGFSRNYLGVHTPQDVLVGFMIGLGSLYAVQKLFDYLDEHPEKEDLLLLVGFLFGIAALIYITFKQYPTDYVNGELLVDPRKMMRDGYKDIGQFVAFCPARYLEKKFVGFKETGVDKKGIILSAAGMVPLFLISAVLPSLLKKVLDPSMATMTNQMILTFYIILIWPAVIKLFQKNQG